MSIKSLAFVLAATLTSVCSFAQANQPAVIEDFKRQQSANNHKPKSFAALCNNRVPQFTNIHFECFRAQCVVHSRPPDLNYLEILF